MGSELRPKLLCACQDTCEWDDVLHLAEFHGLAPLLHKHLTTVAKEIDIPKDIMRGLRFLSIRHKK